MQQRRHLIAAALLAGLPAARAQKVDPDIDPGAFDGLDRFIADRRPDVHSVEVLLRGRVVFAHDKAGFTPETLHDVQSVTKSVLSMLVGIALGQGRIASLDQPVVALMPQLAGVNPDPRAQQLTVRHLLTMTAGFEDAPRRWYDAPGRAQFAMSRKFVAAPGEVFLYDNAAADLLSNVLEAAVGQTPHAFAREQLFGPLGIAQHAWKLDAQGHNFGSYGLSLRTHDMASLGQLFLQQGAWDGRQIVPRDYLLASGERQNAGGPPVGLGYGYLWWVSPSTVATRTTIASGFGGQFVWIHPPLDLVIATTSEVSGASGARGQALGLIRNQLFGAVSKRLAAPSPAR